MVTQNKNHQLQRYTEFLAPARAWTARLYAYFATVFADGAADGAMKRPRTKLWTVLFRRLD
ncbi:MAG: hypothetical protein RLO50_07590 [Azospirillaceae bacterium]